MVCSTRRGTKNTTANTLDAKLSKNKERYERRKELDGI